MSNTANPASLAPAAEAAPSDWQAAAARWDKEWSRFPTVDWCDDGPRSFWKVPPDSGVYAVDRALGERLAEQTVAQMRRFPEGASVLRRILREMYLDSTVGQGFIDKLENILAFG
jgi:hypothetical protein